MKYKFSIYNLVTEVRTGVFSIFNTFSCQGCICDTINNSVASFLINGQFEQLSEEDLLYYSGKSIVVRYDADELDILKNKYMEKMSKNHGLRLVILPTLKCNFDCPYCFEKKHEKDASMSEETQSNIVKFIEDKFKQGIKHPFGITWFGGEPLLEIDNIVKITRNIKKFTSLYCVKYNAAVYTNGYHLDVLSKELIEELGINYIKVTLDGTKSIHDKRRMLLGGGGTFDHIISNLLKIKEYFSNIVIRMNIDSENFNYIPELLKTLRDINLLEKFKYQIAFINTQTGKYSPAGCNTVSPKKAAEYGLSLDEVCRTLGIGDYKYPKQNYMTCSALVDNCFTIDPEGNFYRCMNDASMKERAFFNINTKKYMNENRETALKNFSPFDKENCKKCSYLPLCYSGCPVQNIETDNSKYFCTSHKFSLKKKMKLNSGDHNAI